MKKIIVFVLVLVMAFGLCACTAAGNNSGSTTGKYEGFDSTMYKVLKTGKIKVGVIGAFTPCSFVNASGKWEGFEVDVAKQIAESLGVEIEFVEVTSDTRISSIETGKVDMCMGNSTRTMARCQKVAFSDTLIVSSERFLVKTDSGIKGIETIPQGAKVGVTKGATMDQNIKAQRADLEIVYYTSPTDGVLAVQNGQCVAFAEDSNTLMYQASLTTGVEVVGEPLASISYNSIMLPIADQIWINYINEFVFEFNSSGQNAKLFEQYFGSAPFTSFEPQY